MMPLAAYYFFNVVDDPRFGVYSIFFIDLRQTLCSNWTMFVIKRATMTNKYVYK